MLYTTRMLRMKREKREKWPKTGPSPKKGGSSCWTFRLIGSISKLFLVGTFPPTPKNAVFGYFLTKIRVQWPKDFCMRLNINVYN